MNPISLYSADAPKGDKRRVIEFSTGEILLEHGVVHRIEFSDKRFNLTLKNPTPKRQSVNVKVWVLNSGLVELWHQTEKMVVDESATGPKPSRQLGLQACCPECHLESTRARRQFACMDHH